MKYHGEGLSHRKAKDRLYKLIKATAPKFIEKEYEYPNPFYPDYPWRFDIYYISQNRCIAIEIDGKVGHSSRKAKDKRAAKKKYLEGQGIELFAFPTPWVVGKRALPDELYYEELHLNELTKEMIDAMTTEQKADRKAYIINLLKNRPEYKAANIK